MATNHSEITTFSSYFRGDEKYSNIYCRISAHSNDNGFNQTEVFHFQETARGKVVGHTDETKTKFILEESFLTQLNDWSSKLRSRTLFEFSMDEIQVFEILQENKKVQLTKTVESEWEVGESNGSEMTYQDADEDEILNFFRKMNSAIKFISFFENY